MTSNNHFRVCISPGFDVFAPSSAKQLPTLLQLQLNASAASTDRIECHAAMLQTLQGQLGYATH